MLHDAGSCIETSISATHVPGRSIDVHTEPEEFKNAALFLRLDLPSTLIRYENAALFLRLGLPSTLICHENAALLLRLGLPCTLIRRENAALFLLSGLPSTLIRHENGAFKTPFKPEEFENAGFHFEDGAFRNDDLL